WLPSVAVRVHRRGWFCTCRRDLDFRSSFELPLSELNGWYTTIKQEVTSSRLPMRDWDLLI
ncbi:MAG: hypothetical protein SH820_08270, partial [Xanthomonadales bacterium]|nr:hypothetical protein [Xanthomonadales bacterium]